MKRALVFVDHTDAGCAALEAARRVCATTAVQLTVASVGSETGASPLATAAARSMERTASSGPTDDLAVESIALDARPPLAATNLIDGAQTDVAIIGSGRIGLDDAVLAACFASRAEAVLIGRAGPRVDEMSYRHVTVLASAGDHALRAARTIAGEEALLTVLGVVDPRDDPSRRAQVSLETVATAERHEAEPALVEGGESEIAAWLGSRGAELMVLASDGPTGASWGSESGLGLVARGPADVLIVRGATARRRPGGRRSQRVPRSPTQAQTRPVAVR